MTCTILLVALMTCTVCFIYGVQSDSGLREILSMTGNDPELHKTRDGNNKYGPVRKAIVPKSMSHAMRHDAPTQPPMPIRECEDNRESCVLLRRNNDGYISPISLCKCPEKWGQGECNKTWEDNIAATVTLQSTENSIAKYQFKFCVQISRRYCDTEEEPGKLYQDLRSTTTWTLTGNCICQNNYLDKRELFATDVWTWKFVCQKEECSSHHPCATRFTESRNDKMYTKYTYPCVCPPQEKCPKPQRHENHNADEDNTSSSSNAESKCVPI